MTHAGGFHRVRGTWVAVLIILVLGAGLAATVFARGYDGAAASVDRSATSWTGVESAAIGQTVRFWMWGGDTALNDHIDRVIVPLAAEKGITLQRVPIESTADAMSRIASESDAGISDGSVDLVWVNGANFSQGVDAGLWLKDWTSRVPALSGVRQSDPTVRIDFGVPVDGQELPWSRAAFTFAYDSTRTTMPPQDFAQLADYIRAHPGRVTYPAPPDFTGSAFVRQAVQALGEDQAYAMLAELEPLLWKSGRTHPQDEAELDRLFAAGEIDFSMSYNPNFVDAGVRAGRFAESVRPYVFSGGTLQNVSFVAIPVRAAHPEGAQVVADLLLSPAAQADKLLRAGVPTVLDLTRLDDPDRTRFESADQGARHVLSSFGVPLEELPAADVTRLDQRWLNEVAR
jgi:putative spermidine/putrescine transport system substrate-binding protein